MSDLADLIAKLEAATEGSRELDEAIAAFIAGATLEVQSDGRRAFHRDGFWVSIGPIHPYTTSLDAALTLVPEGWQKLVRDDEKRPDYFAHVMRGRDGFGNYESTYPCWAATAPLALCIDGLRARHV